MERVEHYDSRSPVAHVVQDGCVFDLAKHRTSAIRKEEQSAPPNFPGITKIISAIIFVSSAKRSTIPSAVKQFPDCFLFLRLCHLLTQAYS
jgi:hypothetical protein